MKISIIGHSHIKCMKLASSEIDQNENLEFNFVQLHQFKAGHMPGAQNLSVHNINGSDLADSLTTALHGAHAVVLSVTGNAPAIFGLKRILGNEDIAQADASRQAKNKLASYVAAYDEWLSLLKKFIRVPVIVLPPPPPVGDNDWIQKNAGTFAEALERSGVSRPEYRLEIYQLWCQGIRDAVSRNGMHFAELPDDVFTENGFLKGCYYDIEPSHANTAYGARLLNHVSEICANVVANAQKLNDTAAGESAQKRDVRSHPYTALPDRAFWKQSVSRIDWKAFDPVVNVPFKITRSDKVATAGSCFAQHISKRLRSGGFQFLTMERLSRHDGGTDMPLEYDFSARYGNIYTARQLVQLFDRAYGFFTPLDSHWNLPDQSVCDPFRPRIEENGFPSVEALVADRERHLAAVREMFEQLDIFVFTLGLTECWVSRLDGAAYPIAPGVAGGEFDSDRYQFVNFGVDEIVNDLNAFIGKLRLVNPRAKLILTVSPVPLAATYSDSHVLVATTYSKSVLRVAAEMICRMNPEVYYFPSFEIINGNYNRGRYFGPDLRAVTEEGVDHVMSVFMRHLTDAGSVDVTAGANGAVAEFTAGEDEMMALAEAACDEELLERK